MSRLTCTQCESMLLDAADGVLLPEDEAHFQLHLADCSNCTSTFDDIKRGGAWMEMLKDAPPVPPAGLVDRILAQTSGNPQAAHALMAETAHAASLFGHSQGAKVLPFRVPPPSTPWSRMVHTVMQPRFAMTAAMAFFSIALTLNLAGVRLSSLRASDLRPANVRKSFWAVNSQVVRYYDNLRVVYELESRVREMQRDSDSEATPRNGIMSAPLNTTRPTDETKPQTQPRTQPGGQPHSSAPHVHREGPFNLSSPDGNRTELERVHSNQNKMIAVHNRGEGVQA
ncbi:anti-sigma factor family protein [Terriglobus roseus]|uniref:Putative zinc-finger n=1 Tax=Terriglobus roseus TaxID=392734 RepID=A0A1H4KU48_9BACT|nr:zf-HC2 domain-containing protein [Terriglobus roseus]SEB61736.1 Putative zinc-finger [Terriglobus roseus]